MAYMSQEKKAEIRAELKKVMPKTWKWSLGVNNHSTLVLNIWSAPVNLVAEMVNNTGVGYTGNEVYANVNMYHLDRAFTGERLELFKKIKNVLNNGNHDRSEFDVGWYVEVNLGRFEKPFKVS